MAGQSQGMLWRSSKKPRRWLPRPPGFCLHYRTAASHETISRLKVALARIGSRGRPLSRQAVAVPVSLPVLWTPSGYVALGRAEPSAVRGTDWMGIHSIEE